MTKDLAQFALRILPTVNIEGKDVDKYMELKAFFEANLNAEIPEVQEGGISELFED